MTTPSQELDDALALVIEARAKQQPLNRYHARAVLLPLGAELVRLDAAAGHELVERVLERVRAPDSGWEQAVREELEMAVTEFVKSVDRRFLSRPDYDFAYTLDARARLEDRVRSLKALGLEMPAARARELERADRELAPFLARRK